MTERDVLMKLERRIAEAGGVRPLARRWDMSPSYVCDIRNGRKAPCRTVCTYLGVRPVKTYRPLRFLSASDVAAIFNTCEKTVRNWWDAGRLPVFAYPGSNHRRCESEALKAFVAAQYEGETRDAILSRIDEYLREKVAS